MDFIKDSKRFIVLIYSVQIRNTIFLCEFEVAMDGKNQTKNYSKLIHHI